MLILALLVVAAPASARERSIGHALGRTTVPGRPARVVVLTNEGTEAVLALGLRPVAAVRSWSGQTWYPHIADRMAGVEVVGDEDHPDLARIASLGPDLILGNKLRQEARYSALSAIAPTVFSETLRGDWLRNLRLYAEALGRKRELSELLSDWQRRITEARRRLTDAPRTRVAVIRFMSDRVRMYHARTFSGSILQQLGFARAEFPSANDTFEDLGLGQLASLDADALFHLTWDDGDGRALAREREWLASPEWRRLAPVRANRVFRVDDGVWNTSGGILSAQLVVDELMRRLGRGEPR